MIGLYSNSVVRKPLSRARRHPAALAGALLAALPLTLLWGAPQEAPKGAQPPAAAEANKPAEYVTSAVCQGCHEDIYNSLMKSPHSAVETSKRRGWETKACESCHGPGSKHMESMSAADIRNPGKLKAAQADVPCLSCHINQKDHAGRGGSMHARNDVSCASCHSVHKKGPNGLVARKPAEVNAQCASCHTAVWASFQKPFKHKLPEGAMSCTDCHNPHDRSAQTPVRTANANEPGCFKCHGDKRGPFIFEHAPVKNEGCATCHQPHGSANPMMLTRSQVRFVCLECHANLPTPTTTANAGLATVPPALHDLRSPRFQNCSMCHQKIHGSNISREFFK